MTTTTATASATQAYGETWYWDNRYINEPGPFDGYQKYQTSAPIMNLYVPRNHWILVVGCGNSDRAVTNTEIYRVLKDKGVYILVTYGAPLYRLRLLRDSCSWNIKLHLIGCKREHEMDPKEYLQKCSNMKGQRVQVDGSFVPAIQDESMEVAHLLAEPRSDHVSVDAMMYFHEENVGKCCDLKNLSCEFEFGLRTSIVFYRTYLKVLFLLSLKKVKNLKFLNL